MATFFFYDLETSGFNPREARVMQFAGQRTDLSLQPIGEPHNYLIRMSEDVLPEPDAVLITSITPQATIAEGIHEVEFLRLFHEQVATPDTIFVGYNTVRFDDEFMRYLHYRNFFDPYEWQWQNRKSRWDLLDMVRMTRALRPEGIEWPFDAAGKATNRLELIASLNKLDHASAHDALSDVGATIAVAQLIRTHQPKLFDFLLNARQKNEVAKLVMQGQPFVYTSGKYDSEFEKTTVVGVLAEHPTTQGALVFDLRYDPEPFLKLDPAALAEAMRWRKDNSGPRLPVKTLKFNRCPAVAPLSVLDAASQERLKLSPTTYLENHKKLMQIQDQLAGAVIQAIRLMDAGQQARLLENELEVDARLYEGFFDESDRTKMSVVRAASVDDLSSLNTDFTDDRLTALMPLYKARNFPKSLTDEERKTWETFCERKLMSGGTESRMAKFFGRLAQLDEQSHLTEKQRYLLEELQLYAQSIMPASQ